MSALQGLTETARGGVPIGWVVGLRVLSDSLVKLDTLDQRFGTQGGIMPPTDVWRITHQCGGLIQTFAFHGQERAEGMSEM